MTHIINTQAIILFIQGKSYRVEKTDRKYAKIIKTFDLPSEDQENAVLAILNPVETKADIAALVAGKEGFTVVDGEVYYKGERLPKALATKIASLLREELPVKHFELFWDNLSQNPSSTAVDELMDFLEYKELPITEDGCFIAYKGVNHDFWSSSGNLRTKVLKGEVDGQGRILNTIGAEIEVLRRDVDDDRRKHCSHGLHVGSLDYASTFCSKTLVVKVNPKDVVSVPEDCHCQKCRVSAYKVLSEYKYEIESPVVREDGKDDVVTNFGEERNEFTEKIEAYLERKADNEEYEVPLRKIQAIFSPEWPSRQRVLDALQVLGEYWEEDDNGKVVVYL